MLFHHFLKRFVKVETLNVINKDGRNYCFSATPTPEITIQIHSKSLENRLCYSSVLALGERGTKSGSKENRKILCDKWGGT